MISKHTQISSWTDNLFSSIKIKKKIYKNKIFEQFTLCPKCVKTFEQIILFEIKTAIKKYIKDI